MNSHQPNNHLEFKSRISRFFGGRYTPVQEKDRVGNPRPGSYPALAKRAPQWHKRTLGKLWASYRPMWSREILRVTLQTIDKCNLACRGCYTGTRLQLDKARKALSTATSNRRSKTPLNEVAEQLKGIRGLRGLYFIGAEPGLDPEHTRQILRHWGVHMDADPAVAKAVTITNGAFKPSHLEVAFGEAIDSGVLNTLTISVDSMDPQIHDRLRGSKRALERTLTSLIYFLERRHAHTGELLKVNVQMTVWPENYATVMSSVEKLWGLGVRGFSFHAGTLEDRDDWEEAGLDVVDPLAWRALYDQLLDFRFAHGDELQHFVVPILYMTEAEIAHTYIQDKHLTQQYLSHVDQVDRGHDGPSPVNGCIQTSVPQVYAFSNGGKYNNGILSACNVMVGTQPDTGVYEMNSKGKWKVITDPERNQIAQMLRSSRLCPAMPWAMRTSSDRFHTEAGPLYAICRYPSSNQVFIERGQFRRFAAVSKRAYEAREEATTAYERHRLDTDVSRTVFARRVTANCRSMQDIAEAFEDVAIRFSIEPSRTLARLTTSPSERPAQNYSRTFTATPDKQVFVPLSKGTLPVRSNSLT